MCLRHAGYSAHQSDSQIDLTKRPGRAFRTNQNGTGIVAMMVSHWAIRLRAACAGLLFVLALIFLFGASFKQATAQSGGVRPSETKLLQTLRPDTLLKQLTAKFLQPTDFGPVRAEVSSIASPSNTLRLPLSATTSTTAAVSSTTGIILTLAGGSADGADASSSTFSQPYNAVLAPDGGITVVDTYNSRIRKIDPGTGRVTTVAGSGDTGFAGDGLPGPMASMNFPLMAAYG